MAFRKVKVGVENFWAAWILFRIFLPSSLANFPLHEYFFYFSRPPITFLRFSGSISYKRLACVAWRFCRAGRKIKTKFKFKLLPPQSSRGFSVLARLYYLARPTKTAMLRRLTKDWIKNPASYFVWGFIRVSSVRLPYYRKLRPVNAYLPGFMFFFNKERLPKQHLIYSSWLQC